MTTTIEQLEQKISDLECQMAFQEQTIDELNDALSQQQLLITNMQVQMKFMVGKMKTMDSSNMADASEETPPPHY
ncbi:SlyX family protein [Aliivibrio fischeri]|uniref:Protein SlyX homolog n=3 Tax=Aliivibrio fischeri TaxID=668 RepID=SLYX_ALIF1|nr:SlyX family protein [Aliivibrio fischeri]B5FFZ7.1 RecName: Full=Protein SlyX homolog [Aliivibrio fischeri MJ11]Q5E8C7.1 RecName: Full=Protein SlyX homolog [Aliivibrio fischeri ES114]AAW84719.1 protein SlyX [Aliivibrio fischeri ES114]ACH64979.1 conserved domain protein [Aliivibrio fischeri MJ11]KLU78838.1 protein SlyX-like protein [Aliivibrio fischeri]MBP3140733.1 protein SlyX [Aliivibrio fischeri]MBP3155960.1 protein SlyX [Aliivibrio fischeri]